MMSWLKSNNAMTESMDDKFTKGINGMKCINSINGTTLLGCMKKLKKFVLGVLLFALLVQPMAFADKSQMDENLVQIINQLQAIKPLINQAQRSQPLNPRIKIHFDSWKDAKGKTHNGLRQDIEAIQLALIKAVNRERIEPRSFAPLNNDFVGNDVVGSHGSKQP